MPFFLPLLANILRQPVYIPRPAVQEIPYAPDRRVAAVYGVVGAAAAGVACEELIVQRRVDRLVLSQSRESSFFFKAAL